KRATQPHARASSKTAQISHDTSRNSRSYPQATQKLVFAQVNFALAAKLRADQIRGGKHQRVEFLGAVAECAQYEAGFVAFGDCGVRGAIRGVVGGDEVGESIDKLWRNARVEANRCGDMHAAIHEEVLHLAEIAGKVIDPQVIQQHRLTIHVDLVEQVRPLV